MSQSHDITINLVNGVDAVAQVPAGMKVGDTVRYISPDGKVTIKFTADSPFLDESGTPVLTISDSQPHMLQKEGGFDCRCSLTLPNGKSVGWPASDRSGTHTTVGH
jgi:hypothetical protein